MKENDWLILKTVRTKWAWSRNKICKLYKVDKTYLEKLVSDFKDIKRKRQTLKNYIKRASLREESLLLFRQSGIINKQHPVSIKLRHFLQTEPTEEDLLFFIEKFGKIPRCYLTGEKINLNNPLSYHLDHIIPKSKGGDNTFENMQIATKEANLAKSDLLLEEFKQLCSKVIKHLS